MGRNTHPLIFCILLQTLQQRNITLYINGIRWHIICNRPYTSATHNGKAWQMWQRICKGSASGIHWYSIVWTPHCRNCRDLNELLEERGKIRLDEFPNASRRVHKLVKEFSPTHQGLFQKPLHLFGKALSSVWVIIFSGNCPFILSFSETVSISPCPYACSPSGRYGWPCPQCILQEASPNSGSHARIAHCRQPWNSSSSRKCIHESGCRRDKCCHPECGVSSAVPTRWPCGRQGHSPPSCPPDCLL